MKFKWNLLEGFAEYKRNQANYINGDEEGYGNYVGNVRFGNLCYDIVEWGDHLWFDLYVGGVDTGYGYGVDDYPYDWCDLAGFPWNDYLANTSDEDFKREVEEFIEEHINQFEGYITSIKAIPVDLVAKANEELREW